MSVTKFVLPGDVLGSGIAGVGAWAGSDGLVRASLAGVCIIGVDGVLSVGRALLGGSGSGSASSSFSSTCTTASSSIPCVGARVLARVRRVTTTGAHVDIFLSEGVRLAGQFSGFIAREHTRAGPAPSRADECFRPGDVVSAVVASAGDAQTLFLSTAPLACGVVNGVSDTGARLAPKSATEMMTPDGIVERRKVAKLY